MWIVKTDNRKSYVAPQAQVYGIELQGTALSATVNARQADMAKGMTHGKRKADCHHAPACVGDEIVVAVSDAMKNILSGWFAGSDSSVELELTGVNVAYTLMEKDRLAPCDSDNSQPVEDECLTATKVATITTALPKTIYRYNGSATWNDWTDCGHGVLFIPLTSDVVSQKATVALKFQMKIDGTVLREFESATDICLDSFITPGSKVTLKIEMVMKGL